MSTRPGRKISRRQFAFGSLAAAGLASTGPRFQPSRIGAKLPGEIKQLADADTGREVIQYTTAPANSYPLYYFIPSITNDGRYCIIHSERSGWVQLYRLQLDSGEMVQLTNGATRDSGWFIWCEGHLRGIYNHLSALNVVRREVYYFQDEEMRCTHIDTLANRRILEMPGRVCISQNTFSPDGRQFAFIHADRKVYAEKMADLEALRNMGFRAGWTPERRNSVPCTLGLVDTETGAYRDVLHLHAHAHHVIFGDNETLLVNHIDNKAGMWSVRTDGTGRRDRRILVHQVVTERGIFYEVPAYRMPPGDPRAAKASNWIGCYDLATDNFEEAPLPGVNGYVHIGRDPKGKFLFFENADKQHELVSFHFPFLPEKTRLRTIRKLAPPLTGQRHHAHPFLAPDREWMFHTAVVDGHSQVCAVNVADLSNLDEYWDRRS